ncbi:MAG TPA: hypothetical protein VE135_17005 [Pyrinomonadaceae bacterium]|nr:hypothetical protein [Pyrinomonadaceae bacterium]
MKHIVFTCIAFTALSMTVLGAERTVCFQLRLADDRYNCATPGEAGARRPCARGDYVDAIGHQVELWDKDDGSDDEYIGTWYIGGGGTQCISFEWENAGYSKGEADPDLYLRYINLVNRTGYVNYITVKAVTTDGGNHPATTWRNGQAGDADRYVARNCAAGAVCYMLPSGALVPTNDIASSRGLRIMALDSAQHTLQVLGEMMNRHVRLHYPGRDGCPTSCADDRENFHINGSQGGDGILVGHEIGHTIQMQRFGQDNLQDDLSKGSSGWSLTSDEYDSGATTEGFASYVGIVSWYEPNQFDTVPSGWGLDFEAAAPNRSPCSANRGSPLQVAKGYWDVDDWNNEGGAGITASWADSLRYRTEDIIIGWDFFANGSGNRQNDESDRDGLNMRDYFENTRGWFTAPGYFETFIQHNCVQDQDNN